MKSTGKGSSGRPWSPDDQKALLEACERAAQIGHWKWTPETDELRWSDNLFRLLGLEPGSVTPTPDLAAEMTHPDDRDPRQREIERVRGGEISRDFEYRMVRADGSIRLMRSTLAKVGGKGGVEIILGTVQDITEIQRAESQIAAHIAVSEGLHDWKAFDASMLELLQRLAEAMNFAAAVFWIPDGDELVARLVWIADSVVESPGFEEATWKLRIPRGTGLPGISWRTGFPSAFKIGDPESAWYQRKQEAVAAGFDSGLAVPVLDGNEVIAVFELYSRDDAEPTERMMRSLVGIGHELGQFLAHHRGELGPNILTPRELEVLRNASKGGSNVEIGERMTISLATVKTHLEHIYAKLGVSDRTSAVAKAIRAGLID